MRMRKRTGMGMRMRKRMRRRMMMMMVLVPVLRAAIEFVATSQLISQIGNKSDLNRFWICVHLSGLISHNTFFELPTKLAHARLA